MSGFPFTTASSLSFGISSFFAPKQPIILKVVQKHTRNLFTHLTQIIQLSLKLFYLKLCHTYFSR